MSSYTLDELLAMRKQAQDAVHALMTGTKVVEINFPSGQSIRYTATKLSELTSYISYLDEKIVEQGGEATAKRRKPVRFGF